MFKIESLREEEAKLYKQRFDFISDYYDKYLQQVEHRTSVLEERIRRQETQGYLVSQTYYQKLIDNENFMLHSLERQKGELLQSLADAVSSGKIQKYSNDWYDMCNAVDAVTRSIEESKTAVIEYQKEIQQLKWDFYDLRQEIVSSYAEEAEFVAGLFDDRVLINEKDATFTTDALAQIAMYSRGYELYMEQSREYAEEIKDIERELTYNDGGNNALRERLDELVKAQQSAINSAISMRKAIVDLERDRLEQDLDNFKKVAEEEYDAMKEALEKEQDEKKKALEDERDAFKEELEKELDNFKKLIDDYKSALRSVQDNNNYQRKIQDQTNKVSNLEKQISAYAGDNSEETRAILQKLRVDLNEARKDLEESEYDKFISDAEEMLDVMYERYQAMNSQRQDEFTEFMDGRLTQLEDDYDAKLQELEDNYNLKVENYEQMIQEKMNNIETAVANAMIEAQNNSLAVENRITEETGRFDYDMQAKFEAQEISLRNVTYSIDGVRNSITTGVSDITSILNQVNYTLTAMQQASEAQVQYADAVGTTQSAEAQGYGGAVQLYASDYSYGGDSSYDSGGWGSWFIYKPDSYPKHKLNTETSIVDRLKLFDFDSSFNAREGYYYAMGGGGTYTGSPDQNIWMLNEMKAHGYKRGTASASGGWAWTQEDGEEYIIRKSDGAILTPMGRGDAVLNSSASRNLYQFANNPADFMSTLSLGASGASINNVGNTFSGDISFTITLPNVENYEQFKSALQHDRNFEKMIRAMTTDQLFGGSSLKKYKY